MGAIQPFGALIAFSEANHTLSHCSANLAQVLGCAKLGIDWTEWFDASSRVHLTQAMAKPLAATPLPLRSAAGKSLQVFLHLHGGHIIAELGEPEADLPATLASYHREILTLASQLADATSVLDVARRAVTPIRTLTGYERVMVYRFHEDLHGEVVAEDTAPGLESWLGLHYPASDIPEPARRIFLLNTVRMIPDVGYSPVPLEPAASEDAHAIDLSRALLRAVSPIHIEYLKNMKVTASLTISLKYQGRLWGLIACHHYSGPRYADHALRQACTIVGDYVSGAIRLQEESELARQRQQVAAVARQLAAQTIDDVPLGAALGRQSTTLLDLMAESTRSAAILADGQWTRVGTTPSPDQLDALLDWIRGVQREDFFATDSLAHAYPAAATYAQIASGVLAISVMEGQGNALLWFKPETLQTVTWGGQAEPAPAADDDRIRPRKSFESWKQMIRMTSLPWYEWEKESARSFRSAVTSAELRRHYLRERAARAEAERANQAKEDFVAVVSHDLRDPLSSLTMNLMLLKRILSAAPQTTATSVLQSMERASIQMQSLVNGLLDIAKAEGGKIAVDIERVSAQGLVNECVDILTPLATPNQIRIAVRVPTHELFVLCDRKRVLQALSNLVGNGLKFTPRDGTVTIELTEKTNAVKFTVSDTGPGIPLEDQPHILDKYWRGKTQSVRGVGLGLSIVKAVVDAHDSTLEVASVPGQGASFSFELRKY